MRISRMLAVAFSLMLAGAAVADAQDGPPRGNRMGAAQQVQALMQDITLTADQQTRIDTIRVKYDAEFQTLRASMQGGMTDESRQKMMAARTKFQADLRAVLTAEQQTVFDRNVQAMQQRMQRRTPPPGTR